MKRAAAVPALLFLMLVTGGAVTAQEGSPSNPAQPPLFRTQTHLVSLNVTVTDPDQRFVRGLGAADFAVFEDGVQQEVRFFDSTDVPLDLIILVDTSSSMQGKMDIVHEAAIGFFRTLRDGDRGAVVTFADRVDIVQTLTLDGQELEQAVRRAAARGATALYDAIYIALREFGRTAQSDAEVRRQAIVVLSDGEDTSSLLRFDDVLSLARKRGVNIYPISVRPDYDTVRIPTTAERRQSSEADFSFRRLAQDTGARAFFAQRISELRGIYTAIGEELSSQYSIGYAPADLERHGRYRRIVVQVADRPELRLRTRTGYIAEPLRASLPSPYGLSR